MRATAWTAALVLLAATTTTAHADPPPGPSGQRCAVTLPSGAVVAAFDFTPMTGTVTLDGGVGTRRFKIKAAPSAATYNLVFDGYAPGDQKPAAESLTRGKSVIARLVAYGDVNHLFFDVDYHPAIPATMEGLVCK